ncbi:hypothetical protein BC938DRAFT_477995 [Jimgerdemannia flammicorona]|uniref:CIP2A N-terminal domain-containing protein n=1 Tax=Jimgerdemannia flammicorona TaxID=994334 RepID=A0A433QNJ5_9FUNG|nr:hypothetical protein BC938DRAFT_477995 [Jimgerdemannia flammicorona]
MNLVRETNTCPHSPSNKRLLNIISVFLCKLPLGPCANTIVLRKPFTDGPGNDTKCPHHFGERGGNEIVLLLQNIRSLAKQTSFCLFLRSPLDHPPLPSSRAPITPSSSQPFYQSSPYPLDLFLSTLLHLLSVQSAAPHTPFTVILINAIITLCSFAPGFRARLRRRDAWLIELVAARLGRIEVEEDAVAWLKLVNALLVVSAGEREVGAWELEMKSVTEGMMPWLVQQIKSPISINVLTPVLSCLGRLLRVSPALQAYVKRLPHVSSFYRALIGHLSRQDTAVVVHVLDMLAMLVLEEEVGEKMFNRKNIATTFKLIFNVMANKPTDDDMIDAIIGLVHSIVRSPTARSYLESYPYLPTCLTQTLTLPSDPVHARAAITLATVFLENGLAVPLVLEVVADTGAMNVMLAMIKGRQGTRNDEGEEEYGIEDDDDATVREEGGGEGWAYIEMMGEVCRCLRAVLRHVPVPRNNGSDFDDSEDDGSASTRRNVIEIVVSTALGVDVSSTGVECLHEMIPVLELADDILFP